MTAIEPTAWTGGGYAGTERELAAESVVDLAHRSAHLLHQHGLRGGGTLAVVDREGPALPTVLGTLAAWSLGATVTVEVEAADVALAPTGHAIDADPSGRTVRYGADPPGEAIGFERHLWGENPVEPPESVDPATPAIGEGDHAEVGTAARTVADAVDADRVTVEGAIDGPAALVAAVAVPVVADLWVGPDGVAIDRAQVEQALAE
ncbi:MAG: hypothetical protein ABEJ86_00285 [Halococcoides sp.]